MAHNRNRQMRNRCDYCSNGTLVTLATADDVVSFCSNHIDLIKCNKENHQGEFHSTVCRYIEKAGA